MKKLNLAVGQEVTIKYIGKREKDFNTIEDWTTQAIVEKVGRKLIVVKTDYDEVMKFEVENEYLNKSATSSNYQLYESIEQIKEEIINHDLHDKIKDTFSHFNERPFTTDQLERIMNIINE